MKSQQQQQQHQQQEVRGVENEICLLVTEKIIKYRSYAALPRAGLAMKSETVYGRAIKASSSNTHTECDKYLHTHTHTQSVSWRTCHAFNCRRFAAEHKEDIRKITLYKYFDRRLQRQFSILFSSNFIFKAHTHTHICVYVN